MKVVICLSGSHCAILFWLLPECVDGGWWVVDGGGRRSRGEYNVYGVSSPIDSTCVQGPRNWQGLVKGYVWIA